MLHPLVLGKILTHSQGPRKIACSAVSSLGSKLYHPQRLRLASGSDKEPKVPGAITQPPLTKNVCDAIFNIPYN